MYGLIFIEEPTHIGTNNLMYPKAIHLTCVDSEKMMESRNHFEFKPLDFSKSMEEIEKEALSTWRRHLYKINSDLVDCPNLVFLYCSQYEGFFNARKACKGRLDLKDCRILSLDDDGKTYSNVGKSGAENMWNMYRDFRSVDFNSLKTHIEARKSIHIQKKYVLNKMKDQVYNNGSSNFMMKQIFDIAERLGFGITETNGIVSVLGMASEWRFNMAERPMMLYFKSYSTYATEYKLEKENVYSPLDAMILIKRKDDAMLADAENTIEEFNLEDCLNGHSILV